MASDPERAERRSWAGSEDAERGLQEKRPLREKKELSCMIDRMAELRRRANRKRAIAQPKVKLPTHCYVGVYEDFVKA